MQYVATQMSLMFRHFNMHGFAPSSAMMSGIFFLTIIVSAQSASVPRFEDAGQTIQQRSPWVDMFKRGSWLTETSNLRGGKRTDEARGAVEAAFEAAQEVTEMPRHQEEIQKKGNWLQQSSNLRNGRR